MKRPRWWIIYKIAIILVMVVAVFLFLVDVALGIVSALIVLHALGCIPG